MFRYVIQLLLIILPLSAKPADAVAKWIPSGWKTITTALGDLNKDGLSDIALIVEESNPRKLIKNDGVGSSVLNTNARRLMILIL